MWARVSYFEYTMMSFLIHHVSQKLNDRLVTNRSSVHSEFFLVPGVKSPCSQLNTQIHQASFFGLYNKKVSVTCIEVS